ISGFSLSVSENSVWATFASSFFSVMDCPPGGLLVEDIWPGRHTGLDVSICGFCFVLSVWIEIFRFWGLVFRHDGFSFLGEVVGIGKLECRRRLKQAPATSSSLQLRPDQISRLS